MILDRALIKREAEGRPVRVGLVGAGFMGRSMTRHMLQYMRGMNVVAIANRTLRRAEEAFAAAGVDRVHRVDEVTELERLIEAGEHAVTTDPLVLTAAAGIDVIVEATGELEHGARVAIDAIANGKHLVLVNAELDATIGPLLKTRADAAGVVITNADGDEPGVAMNVVRFVEMIGVKPVMAGNVKGFLDPHRTPGHAAGLRHHLGPHREDGNVVRGRHEAGNGVHRPLERDRLRRRAAWDERPQR